MCNRYGLSIAITELVAALAGLDMPLVHPPAERLPNLPPPGWPFASGVWTCSTPKLASMTERSSSVRFPKAPKVG